MNGDRNRLSPGRKPVKCSKQLKLGRGLISLKSNDSTHTARATKEECNFIQMDANFLGFYEDKKTTSHDPSTLEYSFCVGLSQKIQFLVVTKQKVKSSRHMSTFARHCKSKTVVESNNFRISEHCFHYCEEFDKNTEARS